MNRVKRIAVCLILAAVLISSCVIPADALRITTVVPGIVGDANNDGSIAIIDATCIQRYLVRLPVQSFDEEAADATGDGSITIMDATAVQRYLVHLPCPDGIGKPKKA